MAAAPYKITLVLANSRGGRQSIDLTASDVATAFWLSPSGSSDIQTPNGTTGIVDCITSSAATDCKTVTLYCNGAAHPYVISPNSNQASLAKTQISSAPIRIPENAVLKFVQST